MDRRPICPYADICARMNPEHLEEYSHPRSVAEKFMKKRKKAPESKRVTRAAKRIKVGEEEDCINATATSRRTTRRSKPADATVKKYKETIRKRKAKIVDQEDEEEGDTPSPLHDMASGETVIIESSSSNAKYTVKRTGDHYYCTCMAWRNQNKAVDSRTCKHLKEHLGEKFEIWRCGGGVQTGSSRVSNPSIKKTAPKVMLAHKWTEKVDPTGWWVSEKLDGVRAYWDGTNFLSRNGNTFPAPDWFVECLPDDVHLDGELFCGRGKFQTTVSVVKTSNDPRWKTSSVKYKIFDVPSVSKPFEDRLQYLSDLFEDVEEDHISVLEHSICEGMDGMLAELERIEALGGEGLMLRKPKSKYVNGRTTSLLKVKTFEDAEGEVIGHITGKGKHKDRVGALSVRMKCGKTFRVGTGLSDAERENPPAIGTIITYRFQELTEDGVPRFPSYVGERLDLDEAVDPKPKVVAQDD